MTSPHTWPAVPQWALFAGIFGRTCIWGAMLCFLACAVGYFFAPKVPKLEKLAKISFIIGTLCFFGALLAIGTLFINNQFEYNYVFEHGDVTTSFRYKIAGIWAGQQGSFLLWACTTSLFGTLAAFGAGLYRRYFSIFCAVFLTTIAVILAYETPFAITAINGQLVVPPVGAGLTALLRNYWVVIHPPTIFSGFGSLIVAAAYGFSAMMTGNLSDYARKLRPWAILSAALLGIGLSFGGFWAYETLGWGGFWAWDPVENVSFVPWIFELALIHGLIVQSAKKQWFGPNIVFAGLPFFIFCYGTFLTRSGFLAGDSVHSFVQMNHVALWILATFVVAGTLIYFATYFFKGRKLARSIEPAVEANPLDRQKVYALGVTLLAGVGATTAIGFSIPFVMDLLQKNQKVVGYHNYNEVLTWVFIPLLLAMGIAPFVTWRKVGLKELGKRIGNVVLLTIGATGFWTLAFHYLVWNSSNPGMIDFPAHIQVPAIPWIVFLIALCSFVAIANVWRLIETARQSILSVGGFVSHIGIAVLMAGMIISTAFQQKESVLLQEGDSVQALGYTITFQGMTHTEALGLLNPDNKVLFNLAGSSNSFIAKPGLYYVRDDNGKLKPQLWPHLEHFGTYDIYLTLFAPQFDVWQDPVSFKPGQTLDPGKDDIVVTYHGFQMVGAPGATGTKFIADATVNYKDGENTWHRYEVHPYIQIGQDSPALVPIGKSLAITLENINPATNGADLQVHFASPIYPIDLFYKPMVILVWLGAAVTFLGGLLAAFYRRVPRPKTPRKPRKPIPEDENLDPGIGREETLVDRH